MGSINVLVPSLDAASDLNQWPEAEDLGVQFVKAFLPTYGRLWVHTQRLPLPALKQAPWPFPYPTWLKNDLASADAVLSIGGDNYSFDYRTPSIISAQDDLAMKIEKPVALWGASVGPFDRHPSYIPVMGRHLGRMKTVAVRESFSETYAKDRLGLANVLRTSDPAFTLQPEAIDTEAFWPCHRDGVLGFNLSPLLERYKKGDQNLRKEAVSFVKDAVQRQGLGVLLIPHVMPLQGSSRNDDATYLEQILVECAELGDSVKIAPTTLNAAQLKYVASQLRFFIGARTHATIAALSSTVPTVSIAYSVKARGINRDLFGNEDMVLPTPSLSSRALVQKLDWLLENESLLRAELQERIPAARVSCEVAFARVCENLRL